MNTGAKCKQCRVERQKLYKKGYRCFMPNKCAIDARKPNGPGQHGQARGRQTDYLVQLRMKQKVKRIYQLTEKQFKLTYNEADRRKGATGENLLKLLEARLDNVVYRMGFGSSRSESKQLVSHKAIMVNDRMVNIPSYRVMPGDKIEIVEKSKQQLRVQASLKSSEEQESYPWIDVDSKSFSGVFKSYPDRSDVPGDINEQLVVELYSR